MKLVSVSGSDTSVTFEIDEPSQGLIFNDGFPFDGKIKVDKISASANDVNIIPEMAIVDLIDIQAYLGLDSTVNTDADKSEFVRNLVVFFSASGVLSFDDDNKYKVTLSNLGTSAFDVINMDNSAVGTPIIIQKGELKGTNSEKTENYSDVDLLYFNGKHEPTKMSYIVADGFVNGVEQVRKVNIDVAQMEAYKRSFEASRYEVTTKLYSNGVGHIGFPVNQLKNVTIHHDISLDEDMTYLTVKYKR
ncbi:hypothetical protein BUL40_15585 [Croceivirga radicis]|uniref:Uncharacterized protein n=1 Tax=Croceivirga radicis TaxID=1929488 RepID=A0A1V6LMW4_9FLAO|nr:hypothetical protein [Croceivirga radicis]OQD41498.1 hypothetical protein BUL40_15585 [Croceivirga radicis]